METINDLNTLFDYFMQLTANETASYTTALQQCRERTTTELFNKLNEYVSNKINKILAVSISTYNQAKKDNRDLESILQNWRLHTPCDIYSMILKALKLEQSKSPDYQTLENYINAGIKLIPTKKNAEGSFYQLKKDNELIKIDSKTGLEYWLSRGIERFIFIPKETGLLCIDIDRGHADGVDGLQNFYKWLKNNGLEDIPFFKDIEGGSFPVFTKTPSGGYHLYFKCRSELKAFATIENGVELKYNGLNLTAGGSIKNGKLYSLQGDFSNVPFLPAPMLMKLMRFTAEQPAKKPNSWKKYPAKKGYSPDQLLDFVRKDYPNEKGHGLIFQMAKRLKNAGYEESDTIALIEQQPEHTTRENKQDSYSCIKSLYRGTL